MKPFKNTLRLLALLGISLLSTASNGNAQSGTPAPTTPFLWGVANSSFQVEGSPADSDIYRLTHTPGYVKDGTNADVATDFWNRYDEDFKLAQDLGANAFRISIAWERIEPSRGQWDEVAMAHYEMIIADMRARGLEPVVTLFHNTLPIWVSEAGGVFSKTFAQDFADYAVHTADRLSRGNTQVKYWLTLNEPTTYAEGSYDQKGGSISKFLTSIEAQANAHILAYQGIHALPDSSDIKIGYAQDWEDFEAKNRFNPLDDLALFFTIKFYNKHFLDKVSKALPHRKPALDFLGVNYYNRNLVNFTFNGFVNTSNGPGPESDTNMEIDPAGFEKVLKSAAKYRLPIMVTENGLADAADSRRPQFLRDHLYYLMKAKNQDHLNIIGYLHWSLTDNFEWELGETPRYGLVEIDYANNLARNPRPSYYVYQQLIRQYGK